MRRHWRDRGARGGRGRMATAGRGGASLFMMQSSISTQASSWMTSPPPSFTAAAGSPGTRERDANGTRERPCRGDDVCANINDRLAAKQECPALRILFTSNATFLSGRTVATACPPVIHRQTQARHVAGETALHSVIFPRRRHHHQRKRTWRRGKQQARADRSTFETIWLQTPAPRPTRLSRR